MRQAVAAATVHANLSARTSLDMSDSLDCRGVVEVAKFERGSVARLRPPQGGNLWERRGAVSSYQDTGQRKEALVRTLIIVISAVAALSAFANTARAQAAEQNQQAIPAQYQDDYGHWQHCADATGLCGVTTG
jgi:hypothetical protein